MLSLKELQFAARFPFSQTAHQLVKLNDLSLENIPAQLYERASVRIVKSFQNKPYLINILTDREFLINEVLAFHIAKLLVSLLGYSAISNFTRNIYKTTLHYLQELHSKDALDLATELNIPISLANNFFVVPLTNYCEVSYLHEHLSLKLQNLKNGSVFLTRNSFLSFLAAFSQQLVLSQIEQINPNNLPAKLKEYSKQLKEKIYSAQKIGISSNVSIAAFPPCITALYNAALSGENLPHFSRFALATFLASVGMPLRQIISVFKNTPNFKEKTTRYQVERILKIGYMPYSCEKMKSLMLCVNHCNVKSPLQFYKRELKKNESGRVSKK